MITTASLALQCLTVGQICNRYPGKSGRRLAPSTVTRWILKGCPAVNGTRVKLRATRCGSRWLIDPGDLTSFFDALAATPTVHPTAPPARTAPRADVDRGLAAARAAELLARRGA